MDGSQAFIRDLLADWQAHYQTEVYDYHEISVPVSQGRINQWRLKRSLDQFLNRNDIVFFEWVGPLLVAASHLRCKATLVARLHSWELYNSSSQVNWAGVTRILLVSKAMERKFLDLFPDQAAKTRVVYLGKSLSDFHPMPHEFRGNIGMLCNLVPIKRIYDMILSFHELKQVQPDLSLHIGGQPQQDFEGQRYLVSLHRAIEKLSLKDSVVLSGKVDDPASWLQSMDIFVSNSYWEGQQVALLEAMATGCYCLSHFWDGAEEVLPQDYLFGTDGELRQKILSYCGHPESVKRHHQVRMRDIACEKFDIRRTVNEVRVIIEEATLLRRSVTCREPK